MRIRPLEKDDRGTIESLLTKCGGFTPEEVGCAIELVDFALENIEQDEYLFLCATDENSGLLGYANYGPAALSDGVFELYWIAVKREMQRNGVGSALIKRVESEVKNLNGRKILVETSSQDKYRLTRNFYLKNGYVEAGRIGDFYSIGDDKIIYEKNLV